MRTFSDSNFISTFCIKVISTIYIKSASSRAKEYKENQAAKSNTCEVGSSGFSMRILPIVLSTCAV